MADTETIGNDSPSKIVQYVESTPIEGSSADQWSLVFGILDRISRFTEKGGLSERGMSSAPVSQFYTRIATVLTEFFVRPDTKTTLKVLDQLIRRKLLIHSIYDASGYRGTDHLKQQLASERIGSQFRYQGEKIILLFALLPLEDLSPKFIELALTNNNHEVRLSLLLGWLNQRAVLTKRAEAHRTRLLRSGAAVEGAVLRPALIGNAVNAYMYTSYASTPDKHTLKKTLNGLLKTVLTNTQVAPRPVELTLRTRPKIMVIHERFTSQHAMFRCYAPAIRALAKTFDVIAVSDEENMDAVSRALFKNCITLTPAKTPIAEIVDLIQDQEPDLIYYPSLGMSHWTTALSTLRLAPIQFVTLGHPATSQSDAIDYVFTSDMHGDLSEIFSEKVLVGPRKAMFEMPPVIPASRCPEIAAPATLKIAINSKVMKLSYRLIEICKKLEQGAERPIEFVIFPGERFHYFDGLAPKLRDHLPSAKVMPYVKYEDFIKELQTCHLALAAFPFGNTNSTVDTCLLGIPTVAHFGPESPAQSDRLVMQTIGLPDWLACDTDDEYYATALQLINDDDLRNGLRQQLLDTDIKGLIFDVEEEDIEVFPKMIMWCYQNHHENQLSDQRVFHYRDLPL